MPGPIVRSGPTNQYQQNWDTAFGTNKSTTSKNAKKQAKKAPVKKKK